MLPDFGCEHALLLQGPAGPFFRRFAEELRQSGVATTKINLHAGDVFFFPGPDAVSYRGTREGFPEFVRQVIEDRGIDALFLFGDCRPYHRLAVAVARELGVAVWVFEEGYLRPDWITLEREGVNGYSLLPRDPDFYRRNAPDSTEPPIPVGKTFAQAAWYSLENALAFTLNRRAFPHYEHHRPLNAWMHTFWWVRGGVRKLRYRMSERGLLERITSELAGRYFFVPLQVHCDYQIVHSSYSDFSEFVEEVVAVFAESADSRDHIVLKHHPMDRPFREYTGWMSELAERHGLEDRLWYVHDLHLPTLLKHAKGTVTMNSTVGLSSIHHDTPVKVMGDAVYDLPGLTHQGTLEDFLASPGVVDQELYRSFRRYLEAANQANGNFYRGLPGVNSPTGVRWFPGVRSVEEPWLGATGSDFGE